MSWPCVAMCGFARFARFARWMCDFARESGPVVLLLCMFIIYLLVHVFYLTASPTQIA